MGIRVKVIAVVLAMGMVTAGTGVASAAAVGSAATEKAGPKDGQETKDSVLAKVAARLHVTVKQLIAALEHLKQALGKGISEEAAMKAFAKELKISLAQAKEALQQLSGKDKPGLPDQAVKLLAAELRITIDRARQVFDDLDKIKKTPGDIVKNPDFIAIAKGLGITPQRLLDALVKVKKEMAGKPGK